MNDILDYVLENYEPKDYNKAVRALLTMNKSGIEAATAGSKLAVDITITFSELNRLLNQLSKQ